MTRRDEILEVAAGLFATHGFRGVSVAELGAACGFSGPALYRHFRSKDAILATMLVGTSEELLTVGKEIVARGEDSDATLRELIAWHTTFATENADIITVQDRDWAALPTEAREKVRELQRAYVELWARQVRRHRGDHGRPDPGPKRARAMAHAAFGLLNSTPHSAVAPKAQLRPLLQDMAYGALTASLAQED